MKKIIGILGGLGPEATADLYMKIISQTPAKKDQEHIETIIISNPQIPDRTQAILYKGESPLPALINTAKKLESMKVSIILIPCNTAHYYLKDIQKEISIPIIDMIKETVKYIKKEFPNIKSVGLLATKGTIKTELYQQELKKEEFNSIIPEKNIQENFVTKAIHKIKSGLKDEPIKLLNQASRHLFENGANIIIEGCTEIALVLNKKNCEQTLIDPAEILANKAIAICKKNKQ